MGVLPILIFVVSISAWSTPALAGPPLQLEPQIGFGNDEVIRIPAVLQEPRFRLPRSVTPSHYKLDIQPILDLEGGEGPNDFTAPGHVTITVKADEAAQAIVLHSHSETTIEQGDILVKRLPENVDIEVTGHDFTESSQALTINLAEPLVIGVEYSIEIKFVSLVNANDDGLYRSYYTDANGQRRYIATTQFESIGARRCFPCFDEPALRATFDIRIGRLAEGPYHTLGNTKIIGNPEPIEGWAGWVWDTYEPTPNMPTYLIAIIVSDFEFQEADEELNSKYDVRTYAPPNQIGDGAGVYSADIVAKILEFFDEYFDSPYQLDKMYSVAVEIFAAGAMENWGLNTYRVNLMLWVKGESTQFEHWRQAAVISHELSHQWFGNLFTMTWWNDLWLKEGFARYLQFIGVRDTDPNMESDKRYVLDCIQVAMENDILPNSHPLHRPITDVLPSSNSRIIYEKGASLIRTMQGFLSEETLITALRKFLKKYEYSHATQDQLFDVLTEQAHEDGKLSPNVTVFDIMETWTERTGFPLIRVSRASSTRLFISQEKFYANGAPPTGARELNPTDLWEVPITYATQQNPDFTSANWAPRFWLHKNVAMTTIPVDTTSEWILLNPDVRSYYRVLYDNSLRLLIKAQLDADHEVISVNSRSQLLDDYFVSAFNNYIGIKDALELTTFMDKETELATWTTFFNKLRLTYALLSDKPIYEAFKDYVLSKVVPQLNRVQVIPPEDDKPITAMLRAQLLDWACSMDPTVCAAGATQLFTQWMATPDENPMPADIQAQMYCAAVAASNGPDHIRDFVLERFSHESTTARQRGLLLNSLACYTEPFFLQMTLNEAVDLDAGTYTTSERVTLIQQVARNSAGRDLAFQFLTDRKEDIIANLGAPAIGNVVAILSEYFSTTERITQLVEFIDANADLPAAVITSLNASLARARTNKANLDKYYDGLEAFLDSLSTSK